jgi:hypothetical protein
MNRTIHLLLVLLIPASTLAQRGKNQLQLILEAGFPSSGNNTGVGGFVKYYHGVGEAGHLTLMTGVVKFRADEQEGLKAGNTRMIPVLLGYKHNIGTVFIEPQIGYGEFGGRVDIGGDWARNSAGAFFWALGSGINVKQFQFGVRYQSAHGSKVTGGPLRPNKNSFGFFGVNAGIRLF